MYINPIKTNTTQFNYHNAALRTSKNVNFRGELGDKILKEIDNNGKMSYEEVLKVIGQQGSASISIANFKDIIDSFSNRVVSDKKSIEASEQAVSNIISNLQDKESELNERENALINTESLLKEQEKEKLKSEIKALYGIKDTQNGLSTKLEKLSVITQLINKNLKLQVHRTYPESLIKIVQNKDGIISNDMLAFLEQVLKLANKNDEELGILCIYYACSYVKDENGDIDLNKASLLLSRASFKDNDLFYAFRDTFTEEKNLKKSGADAGVMNTVFYFLKYSKERVVIYDDHREDIKESKTSTLKAALSIIDYSVYNDYRSKIEEYKNLILNELAKRKENNNKEEKVLN